MDQIGKRTALIAFGDAFSAAARAWVATPEQYRDADHCRAALKAWLRARDCYSRAGLNDLAEGCRVASRRAASWLAAKVRRDD